MRGARWRPRYSIGRSVCETNREVHKGNAEMEKFTAVFERGESGWRIASRLEVPEAITQGKTIEEARENLKETIHLVLEIRCENAEKKLEGREVIRQPSEV